MDLAQRQLQFPFQFHDIDRRGYKYCMLRAAGGSSKDNPEHGNS